MSQVSTSRTGTDEAVRLRRSAGQSEKTPDAWASKDTVPLRIAGDRVEAEERAERLRLVTGQRRVVLRRGSRRR